MRKLTVDLQAQPFNSTAIRQKNNSSGHMAFPSGGGRGGRDLSNQHGKHFTYKVGDNNELHLLCSCEH
jgi:hypothetical protein